MSQCFQQLVLLKKYWQSLAIFGSCLASLALPAIWCRTFRNAVFSHLRSSFPFWENLLDGPGVIFWCNCFPSPNSLSLSLGRKSGFLELYLRDIVGNPALTAWLLPDVLLQAPQSGIDSRKWTSMDKWQLSFLWHVQSIAKSRVPFVIVAHLEADMIMFQQGGAYSFFRVGTCWHRA